MPILSGMGERRVIWFVGVDIFPHEEYFSPLPRIREQQHAKAVLGRHHLLCRG